MPLDTVTATIKVIGPAARLMGSVHTCAAGETVPNDDDLAMCDDDTGMSPVAVTGTPEFEWDDDIYVVAYHVDRVGNRVSGDINDNTANNLGWSMSPSHARITPSRAASSGANQFDGATKVQVKPGAPAGRYTITVVDGRTGTGITKLSNLELSFTIADQPPGVASYTLTGMDSVVSGSATYTVAALDANGGSPTLRPNNPADDDDDDYVNDKVSVVVTGNGASNVTLRQGGTIWNLGDNDAPRMLTLSGADANGTFQMVVPPNTPRGQVTFTVLGEGAAVATVPAVSKTVAIGPPAFASSVMAAQVAGQQCH